MAGRWHGTIFRARSLQGRSFDYRVPFRCGTEREREQYPIIFRHPRPHGRRTRSTKHKERSTKYKAQILVRQRCPQEGAPDIPVWWFRAIEQTGMSAPGVWHKFRFLSQHRPIQTLALFAKPRRVLEYVNCLTFFAMSAQPTTAYPSLASFAQPPRMFPFRGSVRYDCR